MAVMTADLEEGSPSWLVGITVALLGCTIGTIGLLSQKGAHYEDADDNWPYWTRKWWIVGYCLMSMGNTMCWLVQGFTSQSILSCLHCWSVVIVFVFAPILFGERPSRQLMMAAAVLVFGCIWVVLSGPKDFDPSAEGLFSIGGNHSFMVAAFSSVLVMAATVLRGHLRGDASRSDRDAVLILTPLEYVVISSVLSSYAVLCSKLTSTLAYISFRSRSYEVLNWEFVGLTIFSFLLGLLQVHSLNMALKTGEAILVLPSFTLLSTVGQVTLCATFFDEFHGVSLATRVSFWMGITISAFGYGLLIKAYKQIQPSLEFGKEQLPAAKELLASNHKNYQSLVPSSQQVREHLDGTPVRPERV